MDYDEIQIGVEEMMVGADMAAQLRSLPQLRASSAARKILIPAARAAAVTVGANPQGGAPPLPLGVFRFTSAILAGALEATYLKEYRATLRRITLDPFPTIMAGNGIMDVMVTNIRVGTTSIFAGTEAAPIEAFARTAVVESLPRWAWPAACRSRSTCSASTRWGRRT
jgi:hypothetical protein